MPCTRFRLHRCPSGALHEGILRFRSAILIHFFTVCVSGVHRLLAVQSANGLDLYKTPTYTYMNEKVVLLREISLFQFSRLYPFKIQIPTFSSAYFDFGLLRGGKSCFPYRVGYNVRISQIVSSGLAVAYSTRRCEAQVMSKGGMNLIVHGALAHQSQTAQVYRIPRLCSLVCRGGT